MEEIGLPCYAQSMNKDKESVKKRKSKDDLRSIWLDAYVALCQTKSYSRAANKLGVNQTDVTRYIQNLTEWSRRILVYSSNPFELTDDGKHFLKSAQKLLPAIHGLRAELPVAESPSLPEKKSAKDLNVSSPPSSESLPQDTEPGSPLPPAAESA